MMSFKKSKLVFATLLAVPLFSHAENTHSSNFSIRLFNNISHKQVLYYYINSEGKFAASGKLLPGDTEGKTIFIQGHTDKTQAEVMVTDESGHTVWDDQVSFYGSMSEFYIRTVTLNPHYNLATNELQNKIIFDTTDHL